VLEVGAPPTVGENVSTPRCVFETDSAEGGSAARAKGKENVGPGKVSPLFRVSTD
jgi:hypothetical protein